jgi:hypothetical protein
LVPDWRAKPDNGYLLLSLEKAGGKLPEILAAGIDGIGKANVKSAKIQVVLPQG